MYTGAPAPMEYIKLVLCRDVYKCPPDQLPSYGECMRALAMIEAEQTAQRKLSGIRKGR